MNIATVALGDYAIGAAALVNSLASAGFDGKVFIGCRQKPVWKVAPRARIEFVELDDADRLWGGNLKSELLKGVGDGAVCYIDADCVVTGPELLETVGEGLKTCPVFAIESLIAASDIRMWKWAEAVSSAPPSGAAGACKAYINSGLLGFHLPRDRMLLDAWHDFMRLHLVGSGDLYSTPLYRMADQDCLNAVVHGRDVKFASIGPPDIWYRVLPVNAYLHVGIALSAMLLHCTGGSKPWRLKAAPLQRPDIYDTQFYRFAFVDTPWVELPARLPKAVERWMRDGVQSRASVRVRKEGARVASVLRTLSGRR